jgi:hypothetical protein
MGVPPVCYLAKNQSMRRLSTFRPQFILMIGDDGVLCVPYKITGAPEPFFATRTDDVAVAALTKLLATYPKTQVTLLADMLAQDFRLETLPRLSPLDRPKLVRRRLKQAFPHARLTASFNVKSSRVQILMAGLHDASPLFDWLEQLKAHTPRIGLLPIEATSLVMKLLPDTKTSWAMLLSRQRTGGFRQIVTHKGELIFTRLTAPLPEDAEADAIAATVQRDIKASLGYLSRLGLSDPLQLRVLLLIPDMLHEALENLELPVHSITCVSPFKTAQQLRLPFVPHATDSYSDFIYAGWLAQKKRLRLSLMLPDMKLTRRTALIKKYGMRIAVAAFMFAFAMTGWLAADLADTLFATHAEAEQLATLQTQLEEERRTVAPITEPLGKLRQAVERQRLFHQPTAKPWASLSLLGQNLRDARLVKLDWQNDDGKPDHEVLQAEVKLANPAPDDREQTIAAFQQVAQNLSQSMTGYNVSVTRYPFPAMPDESVSNNTNDKNAKLPTADIMIRKTAP